MPVNLQTIWSFGAGAATEILAVLLMINLGLTLFHSLQERRGRLWRYFGAIAGVKVPDGFGQAVFFGGLTLALWVVGVIGIYGTFVWRTPFAFGCLGAIIGCRVSDSFYSHIRLNAQGFRPNPGLGSVPLYLVEAAVLIIIFLPGIRYNAVPVLIGFVIGAAAFYSVIPGLRLLGPLAFERVAPWERGMPQPQW